MYFPQRFMWYNLADDFGWMHLLSIIISRWILCQYMPRKYIFHMKYPVKNEKMILRMDLFQIEKESSFLYSNAGSKNWASFWNVYYMLHITIKRCHRRISEYKLMICKIKKKVKQDPKTIKKRVIDHSCTIFFLCREQWLPLFFYSPFEENWILI